MMEKDYCYYLCMRLETAQDSLNTQQSICIHERIQKQCIQETELLKKIDRYFFLRKVDLTFQLVTFLLESCSEKVWNPIHTVNVSTYLLATRLATLVCMSLWTNCERKIAMKYRKNKIHQRPKMQLSGARVCSGFNSLPRIQQFAQDSIVCSLFNSLLGPQLIHNLFKSAKNGFFCQRLLHTTAMCCKCVQKLND